MKQINLQENLRKKFKKQKLPNAEIVHNFGIYLPNNSSISKKKIKFICENFKTN